MQANECDNWSEGETEWHREWKNNFDIDQQEVVKFDSESGEKHIADVYIDSNDLVIEFQHSPIQIEEIRAREAFYRRMIWVVDLIPYKDNITLDRNISDAMSSYFSSYLEERLRTTLNLRKLGKKLEADALDEDYSYWQYFDDLETRLFPEYREKSRKARSSKNVLDRLLAEMKDNPNIQGYSYSKENITRLREFAKDHLHPYYLLMGWKHKHKR